MLLADWQLFGKIIFTIGLLLMVASPTPSIVEIRISVGALNLHLKDMERRGDSRRLDSWRLLL